MGLLETLRQAWADDDIRSRLLFILGMFAIYAIGVHIPVPIRGIDPTRIGELLQNNQFFALLNTIGGGAFKRVSILALGLTPYITASIVMQILTQTTPSWKQEMQEGGEYARRKQNQRIRLFTLILCLFQGWGLLAGLAAAIPTVQLGPIERLGIVACWTAGSMLMLWMGEQISERGIGNGISIMIFAGIAISFPNIIDMVRQALNNGALNYFALAVVVLLFILTTWVIVYFTVAQRRIPIQHMRRNYGTKSMGGQTSYLPISVNMANVMPILFAMSLLYLPAQIGSMTPPNTPFHDAMNEVARFLRPDFADWRGWIGAVFYTLLIFGFTYLWTAIMFNVEDIANNLKRGGSYIPGVRPGKQTMEFLNGVISRVTFVGAVFLAIVALSQYLTPLIAPGAQQALGFIGGTSLLILVSVALETMRQIEANLLVKQYNG